ncbi:inhibitory synaptic factor 2A isoform X1 [Podarcis raffonei]|uniref:inhibitory synaptic factor 2A isoform X1 n=1 Tax=Podarcis raffonei TaxID=65483 RepID=UPI0023299D03|nr:inhibitory synaptic factor 2A isoform X1 [Podarcis raffonei]
MAKGADNEMWNLSSPASQSLNSDGTMESKEPSKCLLTASESEVDPATSLALEMKYALDPNRQIKKRNKALQVRFKDICDAQNEQRDKQLSTLQQSDKKEAKPISYRAAYRKYMTVPARRSIPNVTKSTGVQTSPELKKCYQTFPLDRKKGSIIKSIASVDTFPSQNNGFLIDVKDKDSKISGEAAQCSKKVTGFVTAEFISHTNERMNAIEQPSSDNCSETCRSTDLHSCTKEPPSLQNSAASVLEEPDYQLHDKAKHHSGPLGNEEANPPTHGKVFKTEVASVYLPASSSHISLTDLQKSAAGNDWSLCPTEEDKKRTVHLNGLQSQAVSAAQACSTQAQCQSTECNEQTLQIHVSPMEGKQPCQTAVAVSEGCQQIVPHTEVVDLKAQLQMMENLISSSQETIKVLLGVIQELEKGEAHREGYCSMGKNLLSKSDLDYVMKASSHLLRLDPLKLSYRTGQDTSNCDTCRNSACIIYSVELDFKQQEDKLQPVLRKLHPIEETQVAPLPYSQESYSSTPKQKSKTESKKHGRWKLWFL